MPVIELTDVLPSLMASLAMCECASMMPGETNLPVRVVDVGAGGNRHVRADRGDLAVAGREERSNGQQHRHKSRRHWDRSHAPPRWATRWDSDRGFSIRDGLVPGRENGPRVERRYRRSTEASNRGKRRIWTLTLTKGGGLPRPLRRSLAGPPTIPAPLARLTRLARSLGGGNSSPPHPLARSARGAPHDPRSARAARGARSRMSGRPSPRAPFNRDGARTRARRVHGAAPTPKKRVASCWLWAWHRSRRFSTFVEAPPAANGTT